VIGSYVNPRGNCGCSSSAVCSH